MHTLSLHFLHLMASHWRHLFIIQYQIEKILAIQLFSATCAKMSLKILQGLVRIKYFDNEQKCLLLFTESILSWML
jgi:hypothetical protein